MPSRPEDYYSPPTLEDMVSYVNTKLTPQVDHTRLEIQLLRGNERSILRTPTTGDLSLALYYKEKEAFVASLSDDMEAIGIVQLQGATRSKGYRVATGIDVVRLYASEIDAIATHPDSPYREIYMPSVVMVEGVEMAVSTLTVSRYEALAVMLGLKFSAEEQLYLRKLK